MTDEKIDIRLLEIKFGDEMGCLWNDTIYAPLTPARIEEICLRYKDLALKENQNYVAQGFYRDMSDFFNKLLQEWKRRRSGVRGGLGEKDDPTFKTKNI